MPRALHDGPHQQVKEGRTKETHRFFFEKKKI
jgi:hypothetical protein